MTRTQHIESLPDIPPDAPNWLREWLEGLRNAMSQREGRIGVSDQRFVTKQELVAAGVPNADNIP